MFNIVDIALEIVSNTARIEARNTIDEILDYTFEIITENRNKKLYLKQLEEKTL